VQKDFRNPNAIRDHHAFKFIDLFVASLPFSLARKTLNPFDQERPFHDRSKTTICPASGSFSQKRCK
jgi:hypothetical protein